MAEWFNKLGFKANPLEYDPIISKAEPIGFDNELKELFYRVKSGSIVLIEGPEGSGKTTLLSAIIGKFKGNRKVIYIDSSAVSKQLNITDLLEGYYGFFKRKILRKKPKKMILLLDNVQEMTKRNCERLKFYFDQDYILSVVFATHNYDEVEFSESLIDRIVDTITLEPVDADKAVKIVQARLNKKVLPEQLIRALWVRSGSMDKFIRSCEALASLVVDEGREAAEMQDIERIEIGEIFNNISSFKCVACGNALINISDIWRCEYCEQFCLNCGSLASDKDDYCPGCGLKFEE